ncbi:hypothetical protein [Microbacterium sp. P03]|uniref:alginate O-acetyltransferase AlgX-related protein n=1 Tax=Microbacterium sp. P03 TaxID=3366946 RepID=UPI0037455D26
MSASSPLHSLHSVEQEKPRSRGRRVLYFVPLSLLMIAVVVMTGIGVGTQQASLAQADQLREEVLTQSSQQSSLPETCVAEDFAAHPADIWAGDRTAASEQVFAEHPETGGMRVEGRDGFEFWGDQQSYNISQALGRAPWLDEQLSQWLAYFSALDEDLQRDGRDLVIVVAPAKWELYREKLPEWADDIQGFTHLEQFLALSGDLPVVDARGAMKEAKSEGPVYSKVNTHWNPYGAYAAWQQTVACAASLYPDSVWSQVKVPEMSGIALGVAPNEFTPYGNTSTANDWATPILPPAAPVRSTITGTDGVPKDGPSDGTVGLLDMPAQTSSASGVGRALIMRDSMGEALAPTWSQAFEQTCQLRHNLDYPEQRPDVVAEAARCDADTVLYVFAERYFAQVPPALPGGS